MSLLLNFLIFVVVTVAQTPPYQGALLLQRKNSTNKLGCDTISNRPETSFSGRPNKQMLASGQCEWCTGEFLTLDLWRSLRALTSECNDRLGLLTTGERLEIGCDFRLCRRSRSTMDIHSTSYNYPMIQARNGTRNYGLQNGQIQIYGSKCMDVTGSVNADGTKLQVWDCGSTSTASQQFVYTGFGDNQ